MSNPAKTFTQRMVPRVPMRRPLAALSILAVLVTSLLSSSSASQAAAEGPVVSDRLQQVRTGVRFAPNHGQMHPSVLAQAQSGGATFFFGRDALSVRTVRPASPERCDRRHAAVEHDEATCFEFESRLLRFDGSSRDADIRFEEELPTVLNFFRGRDPAGWVVGVPTYSSITYSGIYEGIDLRASAIPSGIRMTFHVEAGADPGMIRLRPEEASTDSVLSIVAAHSNGTALDRIPATFIDRQGALGIAVGAYDRAAPLEIDADIGLERSTYLGGSRRDQINDIALSPTTGDLGFAGTTASSNWPTENPFQAEKGSGGITDDAVLGMIDIAENELLWSTYFGGAREETGARVVIDREGRLHVAGLTASTDFPTVDPFQGDLGGIGASDGYYARLSPAGSSLEYATYFGGRRRDEAADLMVDEDGNGIWLTGVTESADLPVVNAIDSARQGTEDMYIMRLNPSLNAPDFSTYYGGSDNDAGVAIVGQVVDGQVTIAGVTRSSNFPTVNAMQSRLASSGSRDATIVTIDTRSAIQDGQITTQPHVSFSSYFGGRGDDAILDIEADDRGGVAMVGTTTSLDFPVHEAIDGSRGGNQDAFFTWLRLPTPTEDAAVVMSTFIGGRNQESANALEWDAGNGLWHLAGDTLSSDFPTLRAVQGSRKGDRDAFAYGIDASGLALAYSTYLGGSATDNAMALAFDPPSALWIAGSTSSRDLPLVDPIQEGVVGERDAWIARLSDLVDVVVTSTPTTGPPTATSTATPTATEAPTVDPPTATPSPTDAPSTATSTSTTATPSDEPSPTVSTTGTPPPTPSTDAMIYLPRITKP